MTPEINTIYLGGIRIDEPIVTITDLVISVLSFYYYYKLSVMPPSPLPSTLSPTLSSPLKESGLKSIDKPSDSPFKVDGKVGDKVDGRGLGDSSHLTFFYFKYYFLVMGIATTFGGIIGHAFLYAFTFAWKLSLIHI